MKLGWRMVRKLRIVNARNGTFFNARFFSDSTTQLPLASMTVDPSSNTTKTNNNNNKNSTSSSLKHLELAKFAAIADSWFVIHFYYLFSVISNFSSSSFQLRHVWSLCISSCMVRWDSEGPFKPLHVMNPTRLAFIRSTLCRHFGKDPNCAKPFEGLNIVDVGCGGGILSEPLARMGATVTGVDAVDKNIKIACLHAGSDPETSTIEYCCTTAEKLVEEQRRFDAVIALEVIEHVADPAEFCKSLAALTVEGGANVISTINRSMRAYATAIVAAEYILRWLPKGTHEWSSFLTPEELVLILQRSSIDVKEMAGFVYNPLTGRWSLSDDIGVNFIAFGTKNTH
ncbi:hypothetical protein Dsin_031990 [Dipteronia sinensis]|uniref:Ubiquinone biosynthesis O-methyltransferase, mitochondrial n=1 Tax=Dipteronia sinensis TaxID=43782 RepID=A0AAD9ZNV7_9ROSI|nr:hypothetical protein Dsin_031990 [Dipteronia sinensis]